MEEDEEDYTQSNGDDCFGIPLPLTKRSPQI